MPQTWKCPYCGKIYHRCDSPPDVVCDCEEDDPTPEDSTGMGMGGAADLPMPWNGR